MAEMRLDMLADTKEFVKGVEKAEDALETMLDSFDDLERDGVRSSAKVEKSLKEVADAAKDTNRNTEDLGKGFKKAGDESTEALQEVKDESRSTAKEAAASFDGSAESIVDAFQEVAANAFAGFGAAGLVAGLAAAAGIGIATQAFQANEEKAAEAKQRVRDFGLAIIDSGANAATLDFINENLRLIITDADDATKKFEDIEKLLDKYPGLASNVGQLAQAYAGNTDAIELSIDAMDREIDRLGEIESRSIGGANATQKKIDALEGERAKLVEVGEQTERAKQIEQDYLASGGAEMLAKADLVSQINDAYDETVTSVGEFLNAETGIFDIEGYAASIKEREKLLQEYQTNLASSGLSTEQISALNNMGVDQANAILEGLKDPNVAQETKNTIRRGLTESAKESSGEAKQKITETFEKPIEASVEARLDTEQAQKGWETFAKKYRSMDVRVRYVDREGKEVG